MENKQIDAFKVEKTLKTGANMTEWDVGTSVLWAAPTLASRSKAFPLLPPQQAQVN